MNGNTKKVKEIRVCITEIWYVATDLGNSGTLHKFQMS